MLSAGTALLVVAIMALGGCTARETYQNAVTVNRGVTVAEKRQVAESAATQERLARLKRELTHRIPTLTDEQLRSLTIGWSETRSTALDGEQAQTVIAVLIRLDVRAGVDGKAVVDEAARIMDVELNSLPANSHNGTRR